MKPVFFLMLVFALVQPVLGDDLAWKAGSAKVRITPDKPVWLTGYGARTRPSTGAIQDLHAKALVLDDGSGRPVALVSADVLGLSAEVAGRIAREVEKQHGLSRDRLILNFSHTHCGPALTHPHCMLYGPRSSPEERRDVDDYTRQLEEKVVAVVGLAMKELRPARLHFGHGRAEFAVNRRFKTEKGYVIGVNPEGPVDHDVPILSVQTPNGELLAIVFGYACHNTTIGADCLQFNGDYAGFAQQSLESRHPQAIALFIQGCGGDANPNPRGTVELARRHGEALAGAVEKALGGPMQQVADPVRSVYQTVSVAFDTPPGRQFLETRLQDKDIYFQWQARELLTVIDRDGRLPASYPYPLQVWQFGRDLTLIAMGGEVVVDYVLRLKKELGGDRLWVAGYCNDVFAYVPSARVLREGGYEAEGAMIYYVQPGRFTSGVEETIIAKTHQLVERVRGQVRAGPTQQKE